MSKQAAGSEGVCIRRERPEDYGEVDALVMAAFETGRYDGEAEYLEAVRAKATFVPELSLVAEEAGGIVGQIVLYETEVATEAGQVTALVLSPISVHPAHFRRGIARAMVERVLSIAQEMGYPAVFLCGDPALYRKLGFVPSYQLGITHATDGAGTAPWCMVRELTEGALRGVHGTVDIV